MVSSKKNHHMSKIHRQWRQRMQMREKPPHVKNSSSVEIANADERTIRISRGKACCKPHFLPRQWSVFFAPANYGEVKITRFSSEVGFRTMKHTMDYLGSGPSSEVIALRPMV
jgi:hypothetical protein